MNALPEHLSMDTVGWLEVNMAIPSISESFWIWDARARFASGFRVDA
jgi:hypothetical protein